MSLTEKSSSEVIRSLAAWTPARAPSGGVGERDDRALQPEDRVDGEEPHHADEQQQEREELLAAVLVAPGGEHAAEDHDGGQQDHQHRDAVDAHVVLDAEPVRLPLAGVDEEGPAVAPQHPPAIRSPAAAIC